MLRSNVIKASNLDIVCLCETFLKAEQTIDFPGYTWFGNNRKSISKRAFRGSGGVGILIRNSVLKQYNVASISDKHDGILWLQFINRTTKKQFGICVCYLPPAGSSRGDQSQEFFDTLKALVIDNYHLGEFLICGDFNARCGTLEDTPNAGEIPSRIPVDKVSNQLGKELIETMCALELCTLNGRFDQSKDNFTSVSCKSLAVVDYFICPYSSLNLYSDFQVHDILDIIKSKDIPIDLTIPDHRLLTVELKQPQRSSKINNTKQQVKVRSIPMGYMQDSVVLEQLCMLADQLAPENQQVDINLIYESFCGIIDDQLEITISKPRKPSDRNKPWWDENLKVLAQKVRHSLKTWERNKQNGELKSAYLNSQKEFSKLVRKTKRRFRRERQLKLLEQQKYKPKLFWNFIKGIGSTTQQLPTSVCTSNGEVVTEGNQVLSVWRDYFCSLLNPTNPVKAASPPLEPLELDASILNESFSYEEVKATVLSNHINKSPGYNQIKPMFIKNEACIRFLLTLFNYCFHHGVAPEAWFKTIIKPIPKSNLRSQSPADYSQSQNILQTPKLPS